MKIGRNKQGVLYWTDYIDGKRIKRESKFWKTQKEAREHYNEFIKKLDKDKTLLEDKSYNDVVEEYLKHIQLSHKPSTVKGLDQLLKNTVGSFFENYKIKEIKPSDIEKWQLEIINKKQSNGKPYSNNYLKKLQFSLRQLLDFAVKFDYIQKNPFDLLPIVYKQVYEPKPTPTIITLEQFNRFIDTVDDIVYKTLFMFLFWTGVRIGEAMALTIEDIDMYSKKVHIYKTYDYKNQIMTTTKTGSDRIVTLPDVPVNQIQSLLEAYKLSSQEELLLDKPLFKYSGIIPKTTLDRNKSVLIKNANEILSEPIPYFTFHELRHTHVSILIDLNMKPKDIAERLGHSVEMVNNTYSHLFPERKDLLLDKLNDISKTE